MLASGLRGDFVVRCAGLRSRGFNAFAMSAILTVVSIAFAAPESDKAELAQKKKTMLVVVVDKKERAKSGAQAKPDRPRPER